nr:hypothetical protein [Frankia sp. Cas3]
MTSNDACRDEHGDDTSLRRSSAVDLATVIDLDDEDDELGVPDLVDNAVVTDADTQRSCAGG